MTARIGSDQLRTLVLCSSVTSVLLTPYRGSRALVKRGLLREREPGGGCCITATGLRALATEMEAGRVDDAIEMMRKDVAARLAKIAARRENSQP